jgi:hypothetical protein
MTFTDIILSWHPFYSAVTTANATLAGLLFISLTYNGAIIERPENDHLHRLAEQAIGNFVMLIIVGLLFLIPHQTAPSLGIPLLAVGTFSAYRSAIRLWKQHRHVDNTPYLYWRFITSLVCSLVLIGFAEDLLRGEAVTFFWLTGVVIIFVVSTCSDAWFLLMEIPRDAARSANFPKSVSALLAAATKRKQTKKTA